MHSVGGFNRPLPAGYTGIFNNLALMSARCWKAGDDTGCGSSPTVSQPRDSPSARFQHAAGRDGVLLIFFLFFCVLCFAFFLSVLTV